MALVAEDLNVFNLPHNYMKRLVGEIEKQVETFCVYVCVLLGLCVCVEGSVTRKSCMRFFEVN